MEVRPGYKLTEVGVIPEEWHVGSVGSSFEVCNHLRLPISQSVRERMAGPYPYFGPTSVQGWINEYRVEGEYALIGEDGDHFLKWRTQPMTLLVRGKFNVNNHAHLVRGSKNLTEWFYWFFTNRDITPYLTRQGAGRYKLTKNALIQLPCALPPLPEQRAIAEALGDVDALIGGLERLIAKKRDLKQAAMQQLLTGQIRLPGFSGEWEVKRLGDVAILRRDNVVPSNSPNQLFIHFSLPAFDSGRVPVVEPGRAIGSNKFRIPANAVLVSKLNPRIPRVWMPIDIPEQAVCSTEFLVLEPRPEVSRSFLHAVCSSPGFCEQMELAATGTTGSHQRMNPIDALEIGVPFPATMSEQTAISTVLSDMDAEIETLEQRLSKTRALKQGMMQELLTGRTRLTLS
jgi:type I restriction enzyme, S subunit